MAVADEGMWTFDNPHVKLLQQRCGFTLQVKCRTTPYKNMFEPSPPSNAEHLSKNQDVPRPFVFRALESDKTKYVPGEEFAFALVLIGRALEYLPY
jgi:hypothetical protein